MTQLSQYKTAIVLGLGSSGVAAAKLLAGEGTSVTVIDSGDSAELRSRAAGLDAAGVKVVLGVKILPNEDFEVCVLSPGIPAESKWVIELEGRGVEVLAELEFGWRRCQCHVLAITGSNGKSTMAKLCKEAFEEQGFRTELAGNYGLPVSAVALSRTKVDWLVLEVSSFQLERTVRFRPDVGVLLNLLPNHLDRHGDMASYGRLKARLFANMLSGDTAVVHEDLAVMVKSMAPGPQTWTTFGNSGAADFAYAPGGVVYRPAGKELKTGTVPFEGTVFDNEILGLTAAAASAAMVACGVAPSCVALAAKAFKPLPHRMERVVETGGVEFIDDSKATNLAGMAAALRICKRPVRLLAGGRLKEKDLISVKELLVKKVVMVYLFGEAKFVLDLAWRDSVACVLFESLAAAATAAWKDSRPGDVVLLSPACTSFDQFRSFEERGEKFSQLVRSFVTEEKEK